MKRTVVFMTAAALVLSAAVMAQQRRPQLPEPQPAHPNPSRVVPKPESAMPKAPAGFTVDIYADNIRGPRMMEWAPNGDLFVSQTSINTVAVLRDTNKDGLPEQRTVFLQGPPPAQRGRGGPERGQGGRGTAPSLCTGDAMAGRQPYGIAFQPGYVYIGYTDCIVRYPYKSGDTQFQGKAEPLVYVPGGGNHFARNITFSRDGKKMYVAVGSASNNNEGEDVRRAAIDEYNADGTGFRIFASGLRNPTGLAWQPGTNILWTSVNERDNLGDDLVPDYTTSVKDGGFYGWPFCYIGQHYDPLHAGKMPNLVKTAIVPDILLPAHSAALGMEFYAASRFPPHYRNGAFLALHGSWNRSKANGYKVVFIPFQNGKPGPVEDFLTGFLVNDGSDGQQITTWGRPASVAVTKDGALLVSDDAGDRIWRVRYTGK